ncbi:steroid 17-alpha-hydroxylase 17,20 lyase-like protein [Labeo rohita]|uniref:Steroid 17-alpha-hydroxylase 17,20 lyase-like protein n=1 Tax=Labeo rohita TaxID=84645 RepID=A0A498NFR7_LABRO|nr:steroid 17-alpha-hydroxylase 17,20 lyase-like protein [Labeo rohita]RXN30657.1 steroid 17-alpha-hydroxylase 17,20 lyase-like protein [Labeo rohita]
MNGFVPGDRSPPSLPSLPIIGSLLSLVTDSPPHIFFQQLQKKYGDLYSLMMGSHKILIVNNHHHAKEVLIKKGKIFAGRPRTVTTDLLTRDGKDIAFADYSSTWKFHRKMVHGALCMFGEGSVSIEKIICREASSMCDVLTELQNSAVDMAPELTRAVTNVVCALCFKSSYKRGDAEFESMLQYSQGIVDTVAKDSLVDIFPWLQIFPNKDLKILRQCVSIRDKLLQKKYEEHKVDYSDNVQRDLLDALLRAKRSSENNNTSTHDVGLTEDHVLMTVGDIFGAGVETTTTVLKCVGEYAVQKGTRVIINLWSLHHDEKEWKNPELFDPRRFLNEEGDGLCCPSASYLPFGAGVRVCLGEALAKMELFLFLSWILQRFTLEMPTGQPLPDLQGKFGVVLQPKKFKVIAKLRADWEKNPTNTTLLSN